MGTHFPWLQDAHNLPLIFTTHVYKYLNKPGKRWPSEPKCFAVAEGNVGKTQDKVVSSLSSTSAHMWIPVLLCSSLMELTQKMKYSLILFTRNDHLYQAGRSEGFHPSWCCWKGSGNTRKSIFQQAGAGDQQVLVVFPFFEIIDTIIFSHTSVCFNHL